MEETSTPTKTTIYPLHMFDYTNLNRNIVQWIFRFNDILDPEKLESALVKLLSTGDWRKLGGRLRRNIGDHQVAKHLPKYADQPFVQICAVDWRSLSPEMPTFNNMVDSDSPLIWIRATIFEDATVLGIAFSHVIMDAAAGQCLLRAWSSILNQAEAKIPTVLGARADVLEAIVDNHSFAKKNDKDAHGDIPEMCIIEKRRVAGLGFYMWIFLHIWEWFTNPATMGMLCLPSRTVSALRLKAEGNLTPGTFVSDHDILTAWVVHSSALSESAIRPLCVVQAANLRYLIPSLVQQNGVYLQNLIIAAWIFFSSKYTQASLGEIAYSNREQFLAQTVDEQMIGALITKRDDIRKNGNPCLVYGETNVNVLIMNNLTKLHIMREVDFSSAVIRQGEKTENRVNPPGSMVGFITASKQSVRGPSLLTVTGKDYGGNVWLYGALRRKVWAKLEDDLRRLDYN
ncbi:hypothetical protein PSV08DRAFT_405288 [Bipolaris maydis]|uniref:uncharacterized protein n=1 Tax=Cochliobolus heterostrophus TaxID=5016 RepID=UPI0024D32FAC|nr:hypothetical protein J3E73DRAFT_422124 [Bipolaris maydis]KAJ6266797.1 hypothetical protein PSV08DRAFT_405288 [Bipolaris maydis]